MPGIRTGALWATQKQGLEQTGLAGYDQGGKYIFIVFAILTDDVYQTETI
ncbi:MAG: hypothetical protein JRI99_05915 [Deltaproteobacteria bacterium]|nr:hypothetical protein [Deltaproteobacteria bacterium]